MCVKKVDKLCSNKYDTNYYFESLSQYPVQKVIYDKAVTRQENLHKFEDAEIYIYTDFDAYLKTIYGNYMQLPHVEKRGAQHDVVRLLLDYDDSEYFKQILLTILNLLSINNCS